jgi:methionyl-tRNA formyltransferase
MINVHFSLLPRWRGAAPVERAILAGDAKTGVSIMRIVEGLDQGEVYSRSEVSISATDTLESLRKRLVDASLPLLISAVKNGVGHGVDQTGEVSYAKKISADELRIDWSTSAVQIDRLIRVGGAYTNIAGKRIKIVSAKISPNISSNISANQTPGAVSVISKHECEVATSDGVISLTEVQPEGKSVMTVEVWLNGARIETGAVFG